MHLAALQSTVLCLGALVASPCCAEDDATPTDMLPGVVRPFRQAELAAKTEGVLQRLHVREGDWVEADQLLASLEDSVVRSAVALAQKESEQVAAIELAKVQLNEAESYYERIHRLASQRAASDVELDKARYDVLRCQAEYNRALESHRVSLAKLAHETSRLESHQVRAPFAGRVMAIHQQHGEYVSNDDAVLVLADSSKLRVDLFVPWRFHDLLRSGETYTLASDTIPGLRITATCINIETRVEPASRTFRCRFLINNESQALPSGFAARLCLPNATP